MIVASRTGSRVGWPLDHRLLNKRVSCVRDRPPYQILAEERHGTVRRELIAGPFQINVVAVVKASANFCTKPDAKPRGIAAGTPMPFGLFPPAQSRWAHAHRCDGAKNDGGGDRFYVQRTWTADASLFEESARVGVEDMPRRPIETVALRRVGTRRYLRRRQALVDSPDTWAS